MLALSTAALLAGFAAPTVCTAHGTSHGTTHGSIALDNLDDQLLRQGEDPDALELWLLRLQFLADYRVLDRAAALAEARPETSGDYLQRARARMAVHRFADAQGDLDAARATPAQRATLLVVIGRAAEALPALQAEAEQRPGFTSHCALARGLAAVGRLEEADGLYARALGELQTTLPFPAAAIAFARGLMWSEQGRDKTRGAAFYAEGPAPAARLRGGRHSSRRDRAGGRR